MYGAGRFAVRNPDVRARTRSSTLADMRIRTKRGIVRLLLVVAAFLTLAAIIAPKHLIGAAVIVIVVLASSAGAVFARIRNG